MKVLVLNGSPKERSDTMVLTNAFLKGLNENNDFDIHIIDLIKKNIKPCLGCFKCWKNEEGLCIQQDDQKENAFFNELQCQYYIASAYCPDHLKIACLDRFHHI